MGEKVPPIDSWMPPYDSGTYYSFQHYGASVLGRLFSVDIGTAYNLSFALLHDNEEPKVKDAPLAVPILAAKGDLLEHWITPVAGEPLTFRTSGTRGEQVTLKPLNESWQRFNIYFQVSSQA